MAMTVLLSGQNLCPCIKMEVVGRGDGVQGAGTGHCLRKELI